MSALATHFAALRKDQRGAAVVEFALLGGLFIAMLLGVLQIGIALQSYNAMRSVSADVARYATVQYQTDNNITNDQIEDFAIARAISAPYLMKSQDITVSAADAGVQRVAGAREITLTVQYQVPTVLDLFGWISPSLTFSRPIFVIA